jgi:Xaa-Pro aminopeptidase
MIGVCLLKEDSVSLDDLTFSETERAENLSAAQKNASRLFNEIERTLLRPGITEKNLNDEIHYLAARTFGVCTHWHRRVVRTGPNTLMPYRENPPDRVIKDDDILFVDLGPVFEAWEADFGRTFVLGSDSAKHRLCNALEPVFLAVKATFRANPAMTGEELYEAARDEVANAGWEFGGQIAGHLIGAFPHESIPNDITRFYITRGNYEQLNQRNASGQRRHWILEIHMVDRSRQIGGFYEQLLTID